MRVLLAEDEPRVADAVARGLRREGLAVDVSPDGASALYKARVTGYDVVVLDRDLPEVHGDDVCRTLNREQPDTKVLMVTAARGLDDMVHGLAIGADDYLAKPFALEELLARVRALLRRTSSDGDRRVLRFADLTLDERSYDVYRGERRIELTRTEFLLLELLLRNPRQVLTRSIIFERVWGYDFGPTSNSLEVYIGYLRRKTEAAGEPRLIHTVRGIGYTLRER